MRQQTAALLARVMRVDRTQIQMVASARRALVVGACLGLGVATGHVEVSLTAAFGALMVGIQDQGDSYPQRAVTMLLGLGSTTFVVLIAALVSSSPGLRLVAAAFIALLTSLAAAWGPRLGAAGSAGLKTFPILTAISLTVPEAFLSTASYAVGGAVQIGVLAIAWIIRGSGDTRAPLATAWRAVGRVSSGRSTSVELDAMRTAVDRARHVAAALPRDAPGAELSRRLANDVRAVEASLIRTEYRDDGVRDLLPQSYRTAVGAACQAIARAIHVRILVQAARDAIAAVLADRSGPERANSDRSRIDHALADAAAAVSALHRSGRRSGRWDRSAETPLYNRRPDLRLSSSVTQEAIRLSAMFTVATAVGLAWGGAHEYWVAMTVAVVSMPGYVTAVSRTLSRIAGTLVAVGGIALLGIAVGPVSIATLAALTAAAAFVYYLTLKVNYAIATFGISGFVLLLSAMLAEPIEQSARARVLATIIGGAIVVIGSLIHPRRSTPRLAADLADYADALGAYVTVAASSAPAEEVEAHARRCRALHSKADRTLDDAWAEPAGAGLDARVGQEVHRQLVQVGLYGTDITDGVVVASVRDAAAASSALADVSDRLRTLTPGGAARAPRTRIAPTTPGLRAVAAASDALDQKRRSESVPVRLDPPV